MVFPVVMARAWRGEPWRCLLVEMTARTAYLVGEESEAALSAGDCEAIGFPAEDIFEFDPDLYRRLAEQWASQRRADDRLWNLAEPYGTRRAAAE